MKRAPKGDDAAIGEIIAGVLADRFSKRKLMIASQSVLAVLAMVLALLTLTGVVLIGLTLLALWAWSALPAGAVPAGFQEYLILGNETQVLEIRHDVANGGGTQIESGLARQGTRADRLSLAGIAFDQRPQHVLGAVGKLTVHVRHGISVALCLFLRRRAHSRPTKTALPSRSAYTMFFLLKAKCSPADIPSADSSRHPTMASSPADLAT